MIKAEFAKLSNQIQGMSERAYLEDEMKELAEAIKKVTKHSTTNPKLAKNERTCETANEQYAICKGAKYVRNLKNNESLKRDVKHIEENLSKPENHKNSVK